MILSGQGLDGFSYGERTNIAWTYARIALFSLCLALMATSLLFAVVWILRKLFGGMKTVQHLAVRAIPLLATLSLVALFFCFTKLGGADTGKLTIWTAGIFAFSILFPLLSLYGSVLGGARSQKRDSWRYTRPFPARRLGVLHDHCLCRLMAPHRPPSLGAVKAQAAIAVIPYSRRIGLRSPANVQAGRAGVSRLMARCPSR